MAPPQRAFETSHPWLTFKLDLRAAPVELWALLGEASSKSEHLQGALLSPEAGEKLHRLFLAKGAHATTAIEGNTLTEEEVAEAVEGTLQVPPSREYLAREVGNIISALRGILDDLVPAGPTAISPGAITAYNHQVLDGLELGEGVVPGKIREVSVVVGPYRAAPAEDCEYLLIRLCEWLNGGDFEPQQTELRRPFAIIKAIIAHLYLAWIHPFGDGNGRTARLIEFQILLAAGFPTPAAHLLSNHYNQTRSEYYRQLDRASKSGDHGDPLGFLVYAVRGLVDGLRDQISIVYAQQFADRWEQFVYQRFGHSNSPSNVRRRRLVLDLSKQDEPISRRELRRLSPALAEAYAGKTDKTLTRDLNALIDMDLIEETNEGYQPRKSHVLAFQPLVRKGDV